MGLSGVRVTRLMAHKKIPTKKGNVRGRWPVFRNVYFDDMASEGVYYFACAVYFGPRVDRTRKVAKRLRRFENLCIKFAKWTKFLRGPSVSGNRS